MPSSDGSVSGEPVRPGGGERPQLFAVLVKLCAEGALPSAAGRRFLSLPSSSRRWARPAVAWANIDYRRQQKIGPVPPEPPLRSGSAARCCQGTDGQEVWIYNHFMTRCAKETRSVQMVYKEINFIFTACLMWHVSDLTAWINIAKKAINHTCSKQVNKACAWQIDLN